MNSRIPKPRIGLDTQCFSYLLDAVAGIEEPTDLLAEERKALIRTWFYPPTTFFLPKTVVTECAEIRQVERKEFHLSFIRTLFLDMPIQNPAKVETRVTQLLPIHRKEKDCRVLAESEDIYLTVLLTYDRKFMQRLSGETNGVSLCTPANYWASLGISRGAPPKTVPYHSNPLSQQSWWQW
jgi:hypothetical protein